MALLDIIRRPFERIGTNLENYMGGLLGEDTAAMTPEERRRLRQRAIMAISEGMATMTPVSTTLREAADEEMARRQRMAQQSQAAQRMSAAQQASSQIAGRLLGGAPLPTAPGPVAGDELTGVNVQSQYRRDPMEALRIAMTQAGTDAMQINPFLQPMIQQAMTPAAAPEYVYQNVTGVGLVAVNRANPQDVRVVQREQTREAVAQPTVKTVQLGDGMVQDQWVRPGESSGTPLGVPYKSGTTKPLSSELTSRVVLAQGMRDSEIELARLNPATVTGAFATMKPERMKSMDQKQYETSAKRWAANLLYFKSGAAATAGEIEATWQQYFPLPGDDSETIALKNRARMQEAASVQNALNMAGVEIDLSLPFPKITGPNDENYKKLKPGDVYIDANGNYKTKR
jgi:hypothetical protein